MEKPIVGPDVEDDLYRVDGVKLMKKEFVIFYSWQSDLSNAENRNLIQSSIENAAKRLSKEEIVTVVDRDTKGEWGSPDISDTIFRKIEASDLFAADISFINSGDEGRKTPNPNVAIEVGFAAKALGWDNARRNATLYDSWRELFYVN